jgi:hypothetical protein
MRPARILCNRWMEYTNIGNGFICESELRLIKSVAPNADIVQLPINDLWLPEILGRRTDNVFELWEKHSPDLIIFSGMVNGLLVNTLIDRGYDVLLNGYGFGREVGMNCSNLVYSIARGPRTFQLSSSDNDNIYCGIDVAWFLRDYIDVDLSEEYDIVCLDNDGSVIGKDKYIDRDNYVTSSHSPYVDFIPSRCYWTPTFISDRWQDYIDLYSRARRVLTDRVHCALICLLLGKEVKFIGNTFRDEVFYAAGVRIDKFRSGYIKLDRANLEMLEDSKKSHKEMLSTAIRKWANSKDLEIGATYT